MKCSFLLHAAALRHAWLALLRAGSSQLEVMSYTAEEIAVSPDTLTRLPRMDVASMQLLVKDVLRTNTLSMLSPKSRELLCTIFFSSLCGLCRVSLPSETISDSSTASDIPLASSVLPVTVEGGPGEQKSDRESDSNERNTAEGAASSNSARDGVVRLVDRSIHQCTM